MIKRFIGLFSGFALIAGILGGFLVTIGSYENLASNKPFIVCSSLEQLRDFNLQRANYDARIEQGDNPVLVLASSELNTYLSKSYTASFWTDHNYGMDIMAEGYAHICSLWDAIAVGAFDKREITNNKVVIIPSMQWFMEGTKYSNDVLNETFSKGAYDEFLKNEDISEDIKIAVSEKLDSYEFKYPTITTPLPQKMSMTLETIDTFAADAASSVRLRCAILNAPKNDGKLIVSNSEKTLSQAIPTSRFGSPEEPDWTAIQQDALEYAKSRASNNDLFLDKWVYDNAYEDWLKSAKKWKVDDNKVLNESEIEDFELFIKVCKESGIEPLVILIPSNDLLYDQSAYTIKYRNMYYDTMRNLCDANKVKLADFSDYSASTYFLRDNTHPSNYGWSLINEQIYNFYAN